MSDGAWPGPDTFIIQRPDQAHPTQTYPCGVSASDYFRRGVALAGRLHVCPTWHWHCAYRATPSIPNVVLYIFEGGRPRPVPGFGLEFIDFRFAPVFAAKWNRENGRVLGHPF